MTASAKRLTELRRAVGAEFQVVARPDHPVLLSGPDVLVGGAGKLTALFVVGKRESEKGLLARITGSRLALPSTTRLFGLVSDGASMPSWVLRNFDETAPEDRAWKELARYATSDGALSIDRSALTENKRRHREKFGFAMLLTDLRRKRALDTIAPELVIRELSGGANVEVPSSLASSSSLKREWRSAHVGGSSVTALSAHGRPLQRLRSLCDSGMVDGYQMDTGVPYERPSASLNVLLIESWPSLRHDPAKPARCAAFGCWVVSQSSGSEDIVHLIDRFRDPGFVRRWRRAQV